MFCGACGMSQPADARFCSSCGTPVPTTADNKISSPAPEVLQKDPAIPTQTSSSEAPVTLPRWVGTDWMQAGAAAFAILLLVIAVSFILLLVGKLLAGQFPEEISDGDIPVLQSAFVIAAAALGSDVGAQYETFDFLGGFNFSMIAIPLVLVPAAAARFASDRLAVPAAQDAVRLRAFVAKVALLCALGSIGICAVASISFNVASTSSDTSRYLTSPTRSFFVTLLLVGCAALSTRHRPRSASGRLHRLLLVPLGLAIKAYCISAALVFVAGLIWTIIDLDLKGDEFLLVIYAVVIAGGSIALAVVTFGMGVPVETGARTYDEIFLDESVHLLSSGVTGWARLLLLVVPLALAYVMWRYLEHANPRDSREIARVAARTAACFAALAVIGAVVSGFTFEGYDGQLPWSEESALLKISFNIGLAIVLGVLWGFVGAFLAAIPWSAKRGMPLIITTPNSQGITVDPAVPTEPAFPVASAPPPVSPLTANADERFGLNIPPPDPSTRSE